MGWETMIALGQTVGNYRVTSKLGEGAMGIVYLAEHPVIGRKAALKVIHPEHARNAEVVTRFINEAKAINEIRHEHIVEITDFGRTDDGEFYFSMELLEGQPLSSFIDREAPLDPDRALAIAAQIADALEASHAHGVIHRDLKPENIFLEAREGTTDFVKVLDFGLAKLLNDRTGTDTRAGMVMGTPYYMSPEQCEGRLEIDQRADVYALGVVLFEMLTGKVPFGGDRYGDILYKHMTTRPPTARSLVPALPQMVDAIVSRALAKAPSERFPSMGAFREALRDPANHVGAAPRTSVHDDLSGRLRAARPMARSELAMSMRAPSGASTGASTTFGATSGEVGRSHTDELVPARNRSRSVILVSTAVLGGLALAASLTYGHAAELVRAGVTPVLARAKTVSVSFSSDPDGATVLASNGTTLGKTPLSIDIPSTNAPVEYTFRKPGFQTKTMSLIPSVSSPLFALMQADEPLAATETTPTTPTTPTTDDDPPLSRRAAAALRHEHRHHAHASIVLDDDTDSDGDGVLAPSFIK
jgi:eukaryotic-like serine/threonine-protein kinase